MSGSSQKKMLLVHDTKRSAEMAREIGYICTNTHSIEEKINSTVDRDSLERLCVKMKCALFVSVQHGKGDKFYVSFGRLYNNEVIDYIRMRVVGFRSVASLKRSPEISGTYITIMKGLTKRAKNLFMDIFNNVTHEVYVDCVKYALVVKDSDVFSIRYTKIGPNELEEVGPCFDMEKVDTYFCSDTEFEGICGAHSTKKEKNIDRNENMDKVGRLRMQKQDLSGIKLKRSRGYKT